MLDAVLYEMFKNRNTDIIWIVQGIFCVGLVSERLFFIYKSNNGITTSCLLPKKASGCFESAFRAYGKTVR